MENNAKNKVVAVVGPTGSGKTRLGVELAQKFNGVIVSADSRQVYRGLDVGTTKEGTAGSWQGRPAHLVEGVPQLLVDIVNPGERFTLADWLQEAETLLPEIWSAGKVPIVVGGTGLYVTALLEGYEPGAGRHATTKKPVPFESLTLQPEVDREILNEKSDCRFERIFETLVTETQELLAAGVSVQWLNAIGLDYRYAARFIVGELDREAAVRQYQAASRAYIRRQLTWWRHHGQPNPVKNSTQAKQVIQKFLSI